MRHEGSIGVNEGTAALTAAWLGRIEYPEAWSWQREIFLARLEGECGDCLMLLEHPPTYTLGRRALAQDLVYSPDECERRGIAVFHVDRGGRSTYHGPGQLVGYPIVALGKRYDVLSYLRVLEEALIRTAAHLGVEAHRDGHHTGVWVGRNKLAAIGVKVTRGITMHGFAFNVTTDLSMFSGIVPCGIPDRWVTSIEAETGSQYPADAVATLAAGYLADVLGRPLRWRELEPKPLRKSSGTSMRGFDLRSDAELAKGPPDRPGLAGAGTGCESGRHN
jgi:lipoyl(octanoyl) transferase